MTNEITMPSIGSKFPEFEAQTTFGKLRVPKDFTGKWFILFSHPADFTPVCTTEFVAFNRRYEEFKKLNTELVGLSIDQIFSHIKWVEWIKDNLNEEIKFPIIADDRTIAQMLGMIHPGKGKDTVRAVFIVDNEGILRSILYYPQEMGRNIDELLRMVKGLQIVDKELVRMPANWPNNEILGSKVIVPPATDIKAAQYKKGKYDNYDWWFCYRELEKN